MDLTLGGSGGTIAAAHGRKSTSAPARKLVLQPGEELWVISKPAPENTQPADDASGSGSLVTRQQVDGKEQLVPVPLKHTAVKASIAAYLSSTTVTQQFHNPFAEKIEAVYVFPLPENAAINEFVMTIGARQIRGIIREREEAQKIYNEARSQGYVASLMTQERPNIFTQSVANIEPGKQIDVEVTYYHTLRYADGWYEWVFPMVVGPRYNLAGHSNGIGAAACGQAGVSGQPTEVQYLKPAERSGQDISLALEVNSPAGIEEIRCPSHQVDIRRPGEKRAIVSIAPSDTLPNKDFVLRYRVAGDKIKSGLLLHRDQKGGYFSLMLYPPMQLKQQDRELLEMVFLVDVSGSMSGQPIEQSKAAMRYALSHMDKTDTFQVITFSGNNRACFDRAVPVTKDNTQKAMRFLDDTSAGGGTEMLSAISAALDAPQEVEHQRIIAFLTDGFVGQEDEILRAVHAKLRSARIFSFGVGSSPNRYLMDGLARVGRGAVAYLGLKDDGEEIMRRYFDCVACPAMTDIKVDFGDDMKVSNVFPSRKADLIVGRPVILTGRFSGELPRTIEIRGHIAGKPITFAVPVDNQCITNPALAAIWARHKIADLSDQTFYAPESVLQCEQQIKQTALEYGLMSQFTAFLAVDSTRQTQGDHGTTVAVPVPMPDGVKYETTVTERK